jgi:hypothetical protein
MRRKKKSRLKELLSVFVSLVIFLTLMVPTNASPSCTLRPARSAISGGEVFLGGDYIEIGLSAKGSWGTSGNAPAGFRGRASTMRIGLVSDVDGFCATPTDNVDKPIDYFMPGTPEERWGIGFKISGTSYYGSYSQLNNDDSSAGVTATHVVTDESSGNNLSAKVVSTISLNGSDVLRVTATHSFEKEQAFFKTEVLVTNLYGSELTDVRYHRSFDPDNAKDQLGDYTTRQTLLSTITSGGESVVEAKLSDANISSLGTSGRILDNLSQAGITTALPIVFYSRDAESAVYFGGFKNANPFLPYSATDPFLNPQSVNATIEADAAIGIIVRTNSLVAGKTSRRMSYITSLDRRSFTDLSTELAAEAGEPEEEGSNDSGTPSITSPKLPRFDQSGRVLGVSGEVLELTGDRLYCTTEITVNGKAVSFSHSVLPAADGRAKFLIDLPILSPGYHPISMDSCAGSVTYDRFLFVSKPPLILEGRFSTSMERGLRVREILGWVSLNRLDYNSVQCIANTRPEAEQKAVSFAQQVCNQALKSLATPHSSEIVLRNKSTHISVWYRIILLNK